MVFEGEDPAPTLSLVVGLNGVGFPATPGGQSVTDITIQIATQGGDALQVDRWLPEAGLWESHVTGFPFNDFSIEAWEGYFVNAGQASTFVP